jgi:hypothetical protein
MTRRAFRVLLFLGLLGAAALAGYQGWKLERARVQQLASATSFDTITLRLAQAVIDLRAAERGYVSSGQGFGYWQPRVEALLQQIRQDLTSLKSSTAPDAGPAVDAALDALKETTRLERRIAEAAQAGRIQFAADLVYADGLQASLALERATDTAIASARGDLDAYQRDARIQELILAGESACIGLFLALMWFPSQQKPASAGAQAGRAASRGEAPSSSGPTTLGISLRPDAATVGDRASTGTRTALDLPLRPTPPEAPARAAAARAIQDKAERDRERASGRTVDGVSTSAAARTPAIPLATSPAATSASASASASRENTAREAGAISAAAAGPAAASLAGTSGGPDASISAAAAASADAAVSQAIADAASGSGSGSKALTAAADLCTSLARVTDAQELKGLLAQLSRQLDAVGIIVWLATPDGLSLRPSISHGYPADAMARLDRLDLASDNATARAFRLARPQTVPARDSIAGAIVVPITSGSGCVGAVAAELRHGRELDASTLALARIFAAQLATLTGPAASSDPTS